MSWIIRLQHLPLSANAADIRAFFSGLKIPDGAVHIVGGPDGDAFIGFATDEDARRAMSYDQMKIHDQRVHLLLSSRVEMDSVIAKARAGDLNAPTLATLQAAVANPAAARVASPLQRGYAAAAAEAYGRPTTGAQAAEIYGARNGNMLAAGDPRHNNEYYQDYGKGNV